MNLFPIIFFMKCFSPRDSDGLTKWLSLVLQDPLELLLATKNNPSESEATR